MLPELIIIIAINIKTPIKGREAIKNRALAPIKKEGQYFLLCFFDTFLTISVPI